MVEMIGGSIVDEMEKDTYIVLNERKRQILRLPLNLTPLL